MDILEHNRQAWNRDSAANGEWSIPVSEEIIAAARDGNWGVILTPLRPVPKFWFGDLRGKEVLCLAPGGGQQAPVLAAAGARVVRFDLIFHAVSNVFLPYVEIVWRECYRVLKQSGDLLAGFMISSFFLFDHDESERTEKIEVKFKLP